METPLLNVAKQVRREHRAQEDGVDPEVVVLPTSAMVDLQRNLALVVQKSVRQVVTVHTDVSEVSAFHHSIWRQRAQSCDSERLYLIPHAGFASASVSQHLSADTSADIRSHLLTVSKIPITVQQRFTSDFWILDDSAVLFRQAGRGRWVLSTRKQDCESAQGSWKLLLSASQNGQEGISSAVDLEEPLVLSADLINGVASVLCKADHVDPSGCSWYHGAWQYLRLLDLVSTPTWHHDFYSKNIKAAAKEVSQSPRQLAVTGTADYSMLAYAGWCTSTVDKDTHFHVVDKCPTPLFACKWHANRAGLRLQCHELDFVEFSEKHRGRFATVCTDAFLTRFRDSQVHQVVAGWRNILAPGGRLITTIRIHQRALQARSIEDAVIDFRDRALQRSGRWAHFLRKSPAEIAEFAEIYARRMISSPIGDENQVMRTLNDGGLDVLHSELAEVPGELYATVYLRLVCGVR